MDVEQAPPQTAVVSPDDADETPPAYATTYGGTDNAPPSYNQTVGPPPSYDSIFGQLKETKRQSSGVADFLKKLAILLLGTLGCTIFIGLIMAIPVSMIGIGSYYVHACPVEHYIPIYLIVGGVFGVVKNVINIGQRVKNHRDDQQEENSKTNPLDAILNCFLTAWFIAGNVWIYRIYNFVSYDPTSLLYCHSTLYLFAFWVTTAMYILISTLCCCICCAGIFASLVGDGGR